VTYLGNVAAWFPLQVSGSKQLPCAAAAAISAASAAAASPLKKVRSIVLVCGCFLNLPSAASHFFSLLLYNLHDINVCILLLADRY
jgi:hypothetical protein